MQHCANVNDVMVSHAQIPQSPEQSPVATPQGFTVMETTGLLLPKEFVREQEIFTEQLKVQNDASEAANQERIERRNRRKMASEARRKIIEAREGVEPAEATEEQSRERREKVFRERLEYANQTVFVDGTNLITNDEDRMWMDEHPEFPIPTWQSVANYREKEAPPPIGLAELTRSRFWTLLAQGHESVFDTRHNESKRNKQAQDYLMECQSTGDDSQIRALFAVETSRGVFVDLYTGKEIASPTLVHEARNLFGTNYNDFQAAWWYELINKAQNEGDFIKAMNRGLEIMNEAMARGPVSPRGPRWSESQVMGTLKGVEFQGKSQHLSFKHANTVWDKNGQLQYVGIKGADLMRELTGKFQGYAVGGLSGVDASNLAILAETSLQTSVDYARLPEGDPARPNEEEFINSQFVLQRFAKQVADMRMGLMGSPDGASPEERAEMEIKIRETQAELEQSKAFLRGRTDTSIDMSTGKVIIPMSREKLRTGGAAITAPIWERIAVYSDIATATFVNLKYIDSTEMSPVDKVIRDRVEEFKSTASTAPTEEAVFAYKKKIARQAVAIAEHSWGSKEEDEKIKDMTDKERRNLNRAAQREKQKALRRR